MCMNKNEQQLGIARRSLEEVSQAEIGWNVDLYHSCSATNHFLLARSETGAGIHLHQRYF